MTAAISAIDSLAVLASLAAVAILCFGRKRTLQHVPLWPFAGVLVLTLFRNLSNVLEWSGISTSSDVLEDYLEILLPVLWGFFFYTFLRGVAEETLREHEKQAKERAETELEKARDRLVRQTRLATIGQVSASIAHELRNPLGVVRNAAFYLKGQVPDTERKWQEYLEVIERETASAGQIISELVAMTQGKEPQRKAVDLSVLVAKARFRLAPPETVHWQETYRPDPFVIDVDGGLWEQVLRNLMINSIQAVKEAGEITIEATRSDRYDQILFFDNGPGIPAERRRAIFEPLFTDKQKGTGLGLTICQQIVQRHGGTIEVVDSERGAAFCIRLPRTPAPYN